MTLLVTSRSVLHVSGEHVFPVSPLDEAAAIELFVQRARRLDPSFDRSDGNETDIRAICRRVDGLPLAIELAAARIRTLPLPVLRDRLAENLTLLRGGPRDLPARQQTLRETVNWSVDLLTDPERRALARLSVFPAGATLEAAEAVCEADVDILEALGDRSLVTREDVPGEARFGMLETIREFALELLGTERPAVERAMALHLADLVDEVELETRSSTEALSKLDPEIDNLRAVLDGCDASGEVELGLRIAGGLWRHWWVRGAAREGLQRIESALAGGSQVISERARALQGGAGLAWSLGDFNRAEELAREAVLVATAAGSLWDEMAAYTVLGSVANNEGDLGSARRHHPRSMALAELQGLEPTAQRLNLGLVALDSGQYEDAEALFEEVLASHRRSGNVKGAAFALLNLGVMRHELGQHETSRRLFEEARERFEELGFRAHVAHALQGIAAAEASDGHFESAARLMGQARRELDQIGARADDFGADMLTRTREQARAALGAERFSAAFDAGREQHGSPNQQYSRPDSAVP